MPIVTRFPSTLFASTADVRQVVMAAEALNVHQFRLFRLAHRWWFGGEVTDKEVERPFMQFLFTEQAPPWVRQFVREVLRRKERGVLDPRQFGLPPLPPAPPANGGLEGFLQALHFAVWTVMVAVLAIGLFG